MSEVSTDVKSVSEVVRQRMDGKIAELLPDEIFDRMLEACVSDFITDKSDRYGNKQMSGLRRIMTEEIETRLRGQIKEVLSRDEWQARIDETGKRIPAEVVEKLVKGNMDQILGTLIGSIAQVAIDQALYNLRN